MNESNTESKQAVIERLLNFEYILAFINAEVPGVVLPEHVVKEPTITLKLSFHFEGKMEILPDRVEAVLRFKGQYFSCVLPMDSIWGISTPKGSNYFWMECAPASVLSTMQKAQLAKIQTDASSCSEEKKESMCEEVHQTESAGDGKTIPFLRRVK